MRVGIGLPAAVPDADMREIGRWAAEAERAGFESVGVIDRLIYDNLDPLTALAAAASCTTRVELMSTVVNVLWRNNPRLLAKQLSSVARVSGERLTAGVGMGGWPADYEASEVPLKGRGASFDRSLSGDDYFAAARADTLTDGEQIQAELRRVSDAGCTDLLLFPCSGDLEQVTLLAEILAEPIS